MNNIIPNITLNCDRIDVFTDTKMLVNDVYICVVHIFVSI